MPCWAGNLETSAADMTHLAYGGMSTTMQNIRKLLGRIGAELHKADDIDAETHSAVEGLHTDIEQLAGPGNVELEPVLDTVKALESRFAVNHPVLEQMARELADAIAKMGI